MSKGQEYAHFHLRLVKEKAVIEMQKKVLFINLLKVILYEKD